MDPAVAVDGLDDKEFKLVLDEAFNYRAPRDKEGTSDIFQSLLKDAEEKEKEEEKSLVNLSKGKRRQSGSAASRISTGGSLQDVGWSNHRHRERRSEGSSAARSREGGSCGNLSRGSFETNCPGSRRRRYRVDGPSLAARGEHGGSLQNLSQVSEENETEDTRSKRRKKKGGSACASSRHGGSLQNIHAEFAKGSEKQSSRRHRRKRDTVSGKTKHGGSLQNLNKGSVCGTSMSVSRQTRTKSLGEEVPPAEIEMVHMCPSSYSSAEDTGDSDDPMDSRPDAVQETEKQVINRKLATAVDAPIFPVKNGFLWQTANSPLSFEMSDPANMSILDPKNISSSLTRVFLPGVEASDPADRKKGLKNSTYMEGRTTDENGNPLSDQFEKAKRRKQAKEKKEKAKEIVIKAEEVDGYRGACEINQLLDFIEPSTEQKKAKKATKESKKPTKPKQPVRAGNYSEHEHLDIRKEKACSIGRDSTLPAHTNLLKRSSSLGELNTLCNSIEDITWRAEDDWQPLDALHDSGFKSDVSSPSNPTHSPGETDFQEVRHRSHRKSDKHSTTRNSKLDESYFTSRGKMEEHKIAMLLQTICDQKNRTASAPTSEHSDADSDIESVHSLPLIDTPQSTPRAASYANIVKCETRNCETRNCETRNCDTEASKARPRGECCDSVNILQDSYFPTPLESCPIETAPSPPCVILSGDDYTTGEFTFGFAVNEELLGVTVGSVSSTAQCNCSLDVCGDISFTTSSHAAFNYRDTEDLNVSFNLEELVDYVGGCWNAVKQQLHKSNPNPEEIQYYIA